MARLFWKKMALASRWLLLRDDKNQQRAYEFWDHWTIRQLLWTKKKEFKMGAFLMSTGARSASGLFPLAPEVPQCAFSSIGHDSDIMLHS